jgi:hypothetical protein
LPFNSQILEEPMMYFSYCFVSITIILLVTKYIKYLFYVDKTAGFLFFVLQYVHDIYFV